MILKNLLKMDKLEISLYLSTHLRWIDSVCEIYELILKSERITSNDKLVKIEEYAMYCMEHDRRERGNILLQKLL